MYTEHVNKIVNEVKKNVNERIQGDQNYIIGISGIDGAGKTTLSEQLCEKLNEVGVNTYIIHGDDFLFEKKVRNANPNQAIGYYFETFDYNKLFNEILIPLKNAEKINKVVELLDWERDTFFIKEFILDVPSVIIVEGVLLFKKNHFFNVFDYKIWIDIDFKLGLSRALKRERDTNYYKDKEEITNRYINRFYEGQKLYFEYDEPSKHCNYIIWGT